MDSKEESIKFHPLIFTSAKAPGVQLVSKNIETYINRLYF